MDRTADLVDKSDVQEAHSRLSRLSQQSDVFVAIPEASGDDYENDSFASDTEFTATQKRV